MDNISMLFFNKCKVRENLTLQYNEDLYFTCTALTTGRLKWIFPLISCDPRDSWDKDI